ncbi:MAG: hypothetical protein RUDDFDWM_000232 [Candidatus Fervidibacterota bacterium]
MHSFKRLRLPEDGEAIKVEDGKLYVPDNPIIPFIEGDGIGSDIWKATRAVVDAAVSKAYDGQRRISWLEVFAGEKALQTYGELLPEDTLRAIEQFIVAIKGPLTTPSFSGYRSLNVTLRRELDLYACVRPIRWIEGVPSPVKHPEKVDLVIFRETTEDVYAGIEWEMGSDGAKRLIQLLKEEFGIRLPEDSGIGIKPISERATKRLMRKAIAYALENKRRSITIVHKGNIMKFTEGAFAKWAYEVAVSEFREHVVTQQELEQGEETLKDGKLLIKDVLADNMFQQVLTRPEDYDVLVLPNLNGDYLSDACAAQVGGLGMAPGANFGDYHALFEPTHGSAPKYAHKDVANPSSMILSAAMMLQYIGWKEAALLIWKALGITIKTGKVTQDLARQMGDGVRALRCSEFAEELVKCIDSLQIA